MSELEDKLAMRDEMMQREFRSLSPEERVARMQRLQEWSMAQLAANPEGWDRFMRRNLAKRAIIRSYEP